MTPDEPHIEVESESYESIFRKMSDSYTQTSSLQRFITQDPICLELKERAMRLAYSEVVDTILITGPSGSGKELFARAMHRQTLSPFIAVNMAALPDSLAVSLLFGHRKGAFTGATEDRDGAFLSAGEGTIFLDEIGDMPMSQQAMLLRVLQEKEVTPLGDAMPQTVRCRVVAATNVNLESKMQTGLFREDLYARLMAYQINIPVWEMRVHDISFIAQSFGLPKEIADGLWSQPLARVQLNAYGVRAIQAYAKRWKLFKSIN